MKCPGCGKITTRVVSGQKTKFGYRRFRRCISCDTHFSTIEVAAKGKVYQVNV